MVGESPLNLPEYVEKYNPTQTVIITDTNLNHLYRKQFPPWETIVLDTGEPFKTLDTLENIFEQLVNLEMDRSGFIVAIGGGITCDIAGFAASIYMRGINFGFVSTSLLSQVDASVGGKNGVNFQGYKNVLGVFNQPKFVICDPMMLKTLPRDELLNGLAEGVKHAAIKSPGLFDFLESNYQKALDCDTHVLEKLVYESIEIKAAVVRKDEKEKGERRILNFGHTLGHAVEKITGIPHGQAISMGMVFAANLSVKQQLLPAETAQRLEQLLQKFQLPTQLPCQPDQLVDALKKDKKREGRGIHFVLLEDIGKTLIRRIPINQLEEVVHDMC